MKYIVKEIHDSISEEEIIKKSKEIYKSAEQKPYAIVYGISFKGKPEYFYDPIICNTIEELTKFRKSVLSVHPNHTILVLYKQNLE